MKRTRMMPREIARKMVSVRIVREGGWSVMMANAPRKDDVMRFSFLDYLEREEALQIARLIRQAIVDALELMRTTGARGRGKRRRNGRGSLLTARPTDPKRAASSPGSESLRVEPRGPRKIAREMVTVNRTARIGWSVMVANAPREEATRFRFVDFLEKEEAIGIGCLIRRAIVDALSVLAPTERALGREQDGGGWLVAARPPLSEIKQSKRGAPSPPDRPSSGRSRFPRPRASSSASR